MISRYEIFCEVTEQKSFTKAAEKLGYTQGAISQTVKSIEEELGTRLLERRRDGVTLTRDGEKFYPYIRDIFIAERRLRQEAEAMNNLDTGEIRMGIFTSVSRIFLPPVMKAFRDEHKNVKFSVRHGEYSEAREWVMNGEVDFTFINSLEGGELELYEMFDDELRAILRPDHPLAKKEIIELEDLASEPLILIDEQPSENLLVKEFAKAGVETGASFVGYDEYSIYAMVKQGLGVSAAYSLCIKGFEEGLAVRKIRGNPSRRICIGWKSWESMSYAARKFVEYIKELHEQGFDPLAE